MGRREEARGMRSAGRTFSSRSGVSGSTCRAADPGAMLSRRLSTTGVSSSTMPVWFDEELGWRRARHDRRSRPVELEPLGTYCLFGPSAITLPPGLPTLECPALAQGPAAHEALSTPTASAAVGRASGSRLNARSISAATSSATPGAASRSGVSDSSSIASAKGLRPLRIS
jgi:hypothetical protein